MYFPIYYFFLLLHIVLSLFQTNDDGMKIFWLLYARGVWIKCENGLQQTHWCGVYVCVFAPVIVYVCLTHIFLGLLCRALLLLLSIILHCTQVQHTFYRSWFQPVKYIVIDRLAKHQFPGMKKSRLFIAWGCKFLIFLVADFWVQEIKLYFCEN